MFSVEPLRPRSAIWNLSELGKFRLDPPRVAIHGYLLEETEGIIGCIKILYKDHTDIRGSLCHLNPYSMDHKLGEENRMCLRQAHLEEARFCCHAHVQAASKSAYVSARSNVISANREHVRV